jgi:hypothetical protein
MPEHPRLRWANNAAGYGDQEDWRALQKCEPWHGWVPPEMEPIEDDARDLIEAHARRWLYDTQRIAFGGKLSNIIEMTTHLEPNNV